jgi:abortive infection bacteriophage resistance protein
LKRTRRVSHLGGYIHEKQVLDSAQLVQRLCDRGMVVPDAAAAIRVLSRVNYFRLSAYWYTDIDLDAPNQTFHEGTDFDRVVRLYEFDQQLRQLTWKRIEIIEIALRSCISNVLVSQAGPFAHLDPQLAMDRGTWVRVSLSMQREYQRSREDFAERYKSQQPALILPPLWATVEMLPLGSLISLVKNLEQRSLRQGIAKNFGTDEKVLLSCLAQLNQIRNICAHHGRLWNRRFSCAAIVPHRINESHHALIKREPGQERRLHNALVMLDLFESQIVGASTLLSDVEDLKLEYADLRLQ